MHFGRAGWVLVLGTALMVGCGKGSDGTPSPSTGFGGKPNHGNEQAYTFTSVLSCKFVENGLALRAAPGYGFGRRCHHAPAEAPDPDRRRAVEARGVGPPAEVGPATRPAVED